jgi:hypothetical protein
MASESPWAISGIKSQYILSWMLDELLKKKVSKTASQKELPLWMDEARAP